MQLDLSLQGLSKQDLTSFVKSQISDFARHILRPRFDVFSVTELSEMMSWQLSIAQRVVNALLECNTIQKDTSCKTQDRYRWNDPIPDLKNPKLDVFFKSEISLTVALNQVISEVRFFCSKYGDARSWFVRDRNTYQNIEWSVAFLFYKFVVQIFLTEKNIQKALEKGGSIADEVFQIEDTRHFDRYDTLENIMLLHALSFALSYPFNNLSLEKYLKVPSSLKILDVGGGLGQSMLFNLKHMNPSNYFHFSIIRRLKSRSVIYGRFFGGQIIVAWI